MTPRSEEQILADVAAVTAEIESQSSDLSAAYARRVELYREARALVPPIQHRRLAEIAHVSEPAVIQAARDRPRKKKAAKSA